MTKTGGEAIQMFGSHHPDVTLMDRQMPEPGTLAGDVAQPENRSE